MDIKATSRNVVVEVEMDNKEKYTFSNGTTIRIQKGFGYDLRKEWPTFGKIIDGGGLPKDALVLIHHNSTHESFKIPNIFDDEGNRINNLYSISSDMVFCFREENKSWQPTTDFLITLRMYREYKGILLDIKPTKIPQMLYVVSGILDGKDLSGKVIITSKYADYEVIFFEDGREQSLIRTRVREVMGVSNELTNEVHSGKVLIGNNLENAKIYKQN